MSDTQGKLIATLNSVYEDGSFAEIILIKVVKDEHEGEMWFGENKPTDGTQVDYVLHKVSEVFAAHDLLDALVYIQEQSITLFHAKDVAKAAIAKSKKESER